RMFSSVKITPRRDLKTVEWMPDAACCCGAMGTAVSCRCQGRRAGLRSTANSEAARWLITMPMGGWGWSSLRTMAERGYFLTQVLNQVFGCGSLALLLIRTESAA